MKDIETKDERLFEKKLEPINKSRNNLVFALWSFCLCSF